MKIKISLIVLLVLNFSILVRSETFVIFRYDDYSPDAQGVRTENQLRNNIFQAEKDMDETFEKYNIKYVASIIPKVVSQSRGYTDTKPVTFDQDHEKIELIKKALDSGRLEVAQHGFTHQLMVPVRHRPGEFRQRNYESQYNAILEGREILMDSLGLSKIDTFVPPWNAWDENTALALKNLNFSILSADRYYYYSTLKGLSIIPFTTVLQDFEQMVEQNTIPENVIIVVLYHPTEITRFPDELGRLYFGIDRLDSLLSKISNIKSVQTVTFTELVKKVKSLDADRYRFANSIWKQDAFWEKLLPGKFHPASKNNQIYLTKKQYSSMLMNWRISTVSFIAALIFAGLSVRMTAKKLLLPKWLKRIDFAAAVMFIIAVLAQYRLIQRGYHANGIRSIPLFFFSSFIFYIVVKYFANRKLRTM